MISPPNFSNSIYFLTKRTKSNVPRHIRLGSKIDNHLLLVTVMGAFHLISRSIQ